MKAVVVFSLLIVLTFGSFPEDWTKLERANPNTRLTFHVGLKQQNIQQFQDMVLEISDPDSKLYGKWFTPEKALEIIAPPIEEHDYVVSWFNRFRNVEIKSFRDALKINAPVSSIEQMFGCVFYNWRHGPTGRVSTRQFGGMVIPDDIKQRTDVITGLTAFPIIKKVQKKPLEEALKTQAGGYGYVIPQVVRRLYNIPMDAKVTNSKTTQSVIEFLPISAPLDSDNQKFANLAGETWTNYTKIVGPFSQGGFDTESTLDVQYIEGLGRSATNWYWTIADGWAYEMALEIFNQKNPPLVFSVSYGWPELLTCQSSVTHAKCNNNDPVEYVTRANIELSKVAALGVSVLVATQDEGAPSEANIGCNNVAHPVFAIYPSSSPWVTAVSATTVIPAPSEVPMINDPPICTTTYPCTTSSMEQPCMVNNTLYSWTTGGGFSEYATRPPWQDDAVKAWLATPATILKPPTGKWPANNRGYADISATGSRILIVQGGVTTPSAGTSASTPIIAGIISLLNDYRLNNGKSALGFLNPMLYKMYAANPKAFKDINVGTNRCSIDQCCVYGYGATNGWDPVTGLGCPNYPEMIKYIQTLN